MAGVGHCLGSVLAPDSDDVCLPLLMTGGYCTVVRKEHCSHARLVQMPGLTLDEPFTSSPTKWGEWTKWLLQNIYEKHLIWSPCVWTSQRGDIGNIGVEELFCAPVFWTPGPPTHQQGLSRLCVLTTGCREHSWTTTNLHDPLRSVPVLVPTNISCTVRHHVLVTV